jgi:hypothetical protein
MDPELINRQNRQNNSPSRGVSADVVALRAAVSVNLPNCVRPRSVERVDGTLQVEYQHTNTEEKVLNVTIVDAVASVIAAVGELDPVPERVDVIAHSPDDEPPLSYHITADQVARAAELANNWDEPSTIDLICEIAEKADRFPSVNEVKS